jgi:cyclophilin family peptidyl-prolyl cis-trans isomerase
MKKKNFVFILFMIAFSFATNAQRKDYIVTLETNLGTAHIVLYDETPLHKANFIKLAKAKYYDSLLFHRVINNFMIQGGDPDSRKANSTARLGAGGAKMERIPFEFNMARVHKKGALAAARDGNREKKSNPSQFYIVHGRKFADQEVSKVEKNNSITYSTQQRIDYVSVGGTPALDNMYTVFGEVVDNIALVDKIAMVEIGELDRPKEDIRMKITVKKMSKRRITKKYGFVYPKKTKKA